MSQPSSAIFSGLVLALAAAVSCAGDFSSPISVLGTRDLVVAPNFTPGDLLEFRVGPGGDNQSLYGVGLVRGPTNTTALYGLSLRRQAAQTAPGQLDINALPVALVQNVQVFSLGGGCKRGTTTVFPYIQNSANNFRPFVVLANNGTASTAALAVAGNDQVHAIDCASDPNGQDIYFLVANATQARGELWRTAGSAAPQLVSAAFTSLQSPFFGGVRPTLAWQSPGSNGPSQGTLSVLYQRSNGQIQAAMVDPTTFTTSLNCTLFTQMPAPTSFTVVREFRFAGVRGTVDLVNRVAIAGDYDRNGSAELFTTPITSCAPSSTSLGSAAGGNGSNWTGFAGIAHPEAGWVYLGNGSSLVRVSPNAGQTQILTTPGVGPGGPFDAVGGRDADTGRFAFLVFGTRPGFPRELRIQGWVEAPDAGRFTSAFEGPAMSHWYVYNQ